MFAGSAGLEGAADVDKAEPTRPLQLFFAKYPGLLRLIGGKLLSYFGNATPHDGVAQVRGGGSCEGDGKSIMPLTATNTLSRCLFGLLI